MDYKTRRYKQGLSGNKPSPFWLDKEGHRAQDQGYRDHLRNEDLAERINQDRTERHEYGDYDDYPREEPLSIGQRIFWMLALLVSASLMLSVMLRNSNFHALTWKNIGPGIVPLGLNALLFYGGIRMLVRLCLGKK